MARADLLCDIIKFGVENDSVNFRRAAEAICAEERAKQHTILADKIEDILNSEQNNHNKDKSLPSKYALRNGNSEQSYFWETVPQRTFEQLVLPDNVVTSCKALIEEQMRADLLRSYGLEPRNKILLAGPPGNGKTSLAEVIAEALMVPLLTVRYESIIGPYLGETASRLSKLIEHAKSRQCVLFFDEFETLGKERGDIHETGEIKRVVSSLLMHIDSIPSYVVVIAATNHEHLLDTAAWRRFQLRLSIPRPTRKNLEIWLEKFERDRTFSFGLQPSTLAKKTLGLSYAEVEELALAIYRKYVLSLPNQSSKAATEIVLKLWDKQIFTPQMSTVGDDEK